MSKLSHDARVGLEYRRTAFLDAVTLLRGLYDRRSKDGMLEWNGIAQVLNRERRATQKLLDDDTRRKG